jgi:Domain of unknown function (DUF4335)
MFSAYSNLCRLTPPTCTLEIQTKQSRLSPWQQPNIQDLRFLLSFDDPRVVSEQQITITGNRSQLEELYEITSAYIEDFLHRSPTSQLLSVSNVEFSDNNPLSWQSQGLLSHELSLGSLAGNEARKTVKLSAVQLFDLATALEDYRSQLAALVRRSPKERKIIPLWTSAAAAIVLVVGLTTLGIELTQKNNRQINSTASVNKTSPAHILPSVKEVIPPEVSKESERATPNPLLTEPLASADKLPPPPPVDLPKPPPDIPDPAKFPIPESIASQIKTPADLAKLNQPQIVGNNSGKTQQSQVESTIAVKPETPQPKQKPEAKITKNPSLTIQDRVISQPVKQPETQITKQSEIGKQANIAENSPLATASQSPTTDSQLQEVKAYFQENWKPPADLKQTLEYRLLVKPNGSIARVIPIGRASEIYLDRTNLPLMGEAFISASSQQKDSTIRLLLSPDGSITAFSESPLSTNKN